MQAEPRGTAWSDCFLYWQVGAAKLRPNVYNFLQLLKKTIYFQDQAHTSFEKQKNSPNSG